MSFSALISLSKVITGLIRTFSSLKPVCKHGRGSTHLEGSRRDEGDVVVVQREGLERGQRAKGPLRQELEAVLVQVDGGGLAGELLGQCSHSAAVAQHTAALLLRAGAGGRAGPHTGPAGQHRLGQQAQHRDWGGGSEQSVGESEG